MSNETIRFDVVPGVLPVQQVLSDEETIKLVQGHLQSARYDMAARISRQFAQRRPGDAGAQILAAESLMLNRQAGEAIIFADAAVVLLEDPTPALIIKSRAALEMNDREQAIDHLVSALALQPSNSECHRELGDLYRNIGDIQRAEESYRKSLELNGKNVGSLLNLSLLPGFQCPDKLLKRIEFIIQSRQLKPHDQGHAHFALANIYEQRGDIPRHFRHLRAGNALFDRTYQFNPEVLRRDTKNTTGFFNLDFFRQHTPLQNNDQNIIFIVGMPRSGSTLVDQILCSHSVVSDAGENYFYGVVS